MTADRPSARIGAQIADREKAPLFAPPTWYERHPGAVCFCVVVWILACAFAAAQIAGAT